MNSVRSQIIGIFLQVSFKVSAVDKLIAVLIPQLFHHCVVLRQIISYALFSGERYLRKHRNFSCLDNGVYHVLGVLIVFLSACLVAPCVIGAIGDADESAVA